MVIFRYKAEDCAHFGSKGYYSEAVSRVSGDWPTYDMLWSARAYMAPFRGVCYLHRQYSIHSHDSKSGLQYE